MQHSASEQNSSPGNITIEYSEQFDDFSRELTSIDVDQALYTLKITQQRTISSADATVSVLPKQECDCCRLLRTSSSSRLSLPLARRGRPHNSTRSDRLLCSSCTEIKRQQQTDISQKPEKSPSDHIYQTIINFDISSAERTALNNQYQSPQMLVWRINTSDGNTIDLSYDTDALTESEKKYLLEETIRKLQIILNNRPIRNDDQDNTEFTYRTLQTTINILSSSRNSI